MFAIVTGLLLAAVPSAPATTFTVPNAAPEGPGSLRDAVQQANADSLTSDTIVFAIPGTGPHTITLTSATGSTIHVGAPVLIDATTQNGYQPWRPAVKILVEQEVPVETFTGVGCLFLHGGHTTVRGLAFENRDFYALIPSTDGNDRIEACVFGGDDPAASGYGYPYISLYFSPGTVIGSAVPGMGNLFKNCFTECISMVTVDDVAVIGNYFGLDPVNSTVYRCARTAVSMQDTYRCRIGGSGPGERYIIAGSDVGVYISGDPSIR